MTTGQAPSSQMMIRTKENVLSGPFPKEEIVRRILNGQLREADEVCTGNGYWIFLHERGECRSLLGVELARREEFHEERTETGTDTETVTATKPVDATDRIQKFEEHVDSVRNQTISGPAPRPVARPKGQTETLGAFKVLLWGVLILVGFILFQVFRITDGF